ncbi:formyltetrahydrofolate deformylase [Desulfurobacterium thermolithotrophum DSM 11699]|uniref:Formyltetrahydrofolate deformylase n=1 Tax=Desulfurobacterium thermolithotrophum (strain DSM 11699 / BSA) TaxID=868864 RepID=F0S275_DESTD|nr:formyltetrahydrofolate deformylase [Desulfurobacterium thermolithotrophum]ADY73018.1 formyltetrahydrofolate deformylase [Desulfurobacterium thermolithotrophum DSM 11699]
MRETAILLISCPDRKGILAEITGFIAKHGGNILHADQHIDFQKEIFFMRIEWDLSNFEIPKEKLPESFQPIAEKFQMDYQIKFSSDIQNVAIFVSKYDHCLYELLYRFKAGELRGNLKFVISNHPDLKPVVEMYGVPFYHFPKSKKNKLEVEEKEIELLKKEKIDLIILARYMQILSDRFVNEFRNKIINIHHSFLPAFVGAKPYHRAYERGVKIIGATSHYVTEELDQGPIIEQDVVRVSHRDSIEDMIRKGRDLEKLVLARAVRWHLENKILVYDNKTVIFD